MAIIGDTYLTAKGFEIANKSANGQSSFTLTRVVSSPNQVSNNPDEIKKLNNLTGEMNTGQIINTDVRSENLTGITVNFLNDIYTNGYDIGSIGIYAKESNSDNEFMYSVTPFLTKQQIPELNNNVFSGYEVTIYLIAGDSQRMNVSLSKGGDASIDLVEKLISNSEAETQKKLDEVNRRVDSLNLGKADKTDLKELQNNVGGDLQNRLTSLNNGKADKVSVYSKSDVDSKDIQTFNSANSYTDQKYNDLSNKNNILSSRLEDYQKPNIAPVTKVDNWHGWWNYPYSFNVEQGKTYILSAYFNNVTSGYGYFYSVDANGPNANANAWNGGQTDWISQGNSGLNIAKYTADSTRTINFGFGYNTVDKVSNICITQSDNYVPFEIAEQNKASIENEGLYSNYNKPNLINNQNDWYPLENGTQVNLGYITLKAGLPYCISVDYTADVDKWKGYDSTIISSIPIPEYKDSLNYNPHQNYNNQHPRVKIVPNQDTSFYFAISRWGMTDGIYGAFRHAQITQTDDFIPYSLAQRNREIDNKTNDLSNKIQSSHDDLNLAKADKYNSYTKDDVDTKIKNSHDDLNLAKADKYNTYTKDDTDTRIAWAKAELNNNKQDKQNSTDKFDWLNTVKANTVDKDNDIRNAFNQANAYTNSVANAKQDKAGVGTVENGYNLDGFTWYADFGLFNVNLATLGANLGLDMNYYSFWGWLAVRPSYNAVYQYLYDNMGNQWYRTTGQVWHKIATTDDIASIKKSAWRELKTNGGNGNTPIVCKINFSNNTLKIVGSSESSNGKVLTLYHDDDFKFLSPKSNDVSFGAPSYQFLNTFSADNNGDLNIQISGYGSFSLMGYYKYPIQVI